MNRIAKEEFEQGFTLVELLLATFIFSIVISSVYGAYRASFKVIHGSEAHLAISRNARVAMERITDDLRSIVAGPGGEFHGERIDLAGTRSDSMAFISSSHLVLSKKDSLAGYAVIVYSAERNGDNGLLNLYRSDRVVLPGVEQEEKDSRKDILAEGLQEINFSYLDVDNKVVDEWQGDDALKEQETGEKHSEPLLPALVYVKLVFADANESKDGTVFATAVALPQRAKDKR